MDTFLLTDEGCVVHKSSGMKYQVFIGAKKLWFICAKERDLLNALQSIGNLAVCNCKKITEILSKYHVYWCGNAVIRCKDSSFHGLNQYETKDIYNNYMDL